MATGKYLSLEEARKTGEETRFAREHQSTGNEDALLGTIEAMVKKPELVDQTSNLKRRDED